VTESKLRIEVSPEMVTFVGVGALLEGAWPDDSVVVSFAGCGGDAAPRLSFEPHPQGYSAIDADVVLVVRRVTCQRLFGSLPKSAGTWFMPSHLCAVVQSIRDCEADAAARETLQGARSVDLLCQAFAEFAKGELVPADGGGARNQSDAVRIAAARRLVDECWQEKLTLDGIARACGINRDKLSRGFRTVYKSTVADVLAENRLSGAKRLLLATDLPIATVGYRCGYLNNASFTRAFTRRYGLAPSQLRHGTIAA
jgi:AraC family transcriptional regulator, transcriptional activator of the genes for pyochelin and ferripyochelin receptors